MGYLAHHQHRQQQQHFLPPSRQHYANAIAHHHYNNIPLSFSRHHSPTLSRSRSYPQLLVPPTPSSSKCSFHSFALGSARPPSTVRSSRQTLLLSSSHYYKRLAKASSSENHLDRGRPSLLSDIVQAQLALWTLVGTVFYSYVWQQHRKKFLVSLFVVIPPVLVICCTLSSLLTAIVILGRVFSSPLRFQDILQMDGEMVVGDESDGSAGAYGSIGGGSGSGMVRRRRTVSGTSCHSCHGIAARALSMSCDELPKPMCRKHSTSKSSTLSLYGSSANNGSAAGGAIISNGIIGAYGTSNGAIPGNITPAAVRAAADSIGGIGGGAAGGMGMGGGMGGMPVPGMVGVQPRLSHQYSHYPSEGIVDT